MLEELNNRLNFWKEILNLTEWTISLKFLSASDMDGGIAKTYLKDNIQTAEISFLNINERKDADRSLESLELDLLHELVHIRFWFVRTADEKNYLENTLIEQAIENTAKAFLKLYRMKEINI